MNTEKDITIKIAKDFTDAPGARYKSDGPFSGEEFRDTIFIPKLEEAMNKNCKLIVDLDGTFGYAISFLSEVFSGLYSKYEKSVILNTIEIISFDEPPLKRKIYKLMQE